MDAKTKPSHGAELIAAGWKQGALLPDAAIRGAVWTRDGSDWKLVQHASSGDQWVVVSQSCDILSAAESSVEVMRACWTREPNVLSSAKKGNSSRRFLLQVRVASDGKTKEGLVADATTRAWIDKKSLVGMEVTTQATEADGVQRFVDWIGQRYSRPALPDEVVASIVKPISEALSNLPKADPKRKLLQQIDEIRFLVTANEQPPRVALLILREPGAAPSQAEEFAFTGWLAKEVRTAGGAVIEDARFMTTETVSVADYLKTTALLLDYVTPPPA